MAKYQLLVVTNPVEGREDEYNDWYDNQHLADVIAMDGYTAAKRYTVTALMGDKPAGTYAAVYEMETEDPITAFESLGKAMDAGTMYISDAMDPVRLSVSLLTPIG
ncbi:DUF4286 family protein [Sphingomonas crocodyli]|uniref:DUF4286 family protein n=1 Tax=Sphingomonas crocodyli TaxID=1979270 RepID=A0A437M9Y4_9SPHN|nr:DUF4286 family protein [Sphingomonas crocodyli]RVT94450.1 hypothetical protein EOD43_11620 [Sphingomonas crocodyli]